MMSGFNHFMVFCLVDFLLWCFDGVYFFNLFFLPSFLIFIFTS